MFLRSGIPRSAVSGIGGSRSSACLEWRHPKVRMLHANMATLAEPKYPLSKIMRLIAARSLILVGFYAVVAACGGTTESGTGQNQKQIDGSIDDTGTGPLASPTACSSDSDCALGEINHEIRSKADCVCLYGCPYLALSKDTIARRQSQYNALCDPNIDGNGNPCGVDDCAVPPNPLCVAGECTFSRDAAP